MGGNKFADELHYMADQLGIDDFICELNVIDNFWTARVDLILFHLVTWTLRNNAN